MQDYLCNFRLRPYLTSLDAYYHVKCKDFLTFLYKLHSGNATICTYSMRAHPIPIVFFLVSQTLFCSQDAEYIYMHFILLYFSNLILLLGLLLITQNM